MHHILDSITFYQVIHGVRSFDMSKLIFSIFLRCELRNYVWYQILENYPHDKCCTSHQLCVKFYGIFFFFTKHFNSRNSKRKPRLTLHLCRHKVAGITAVFPSFLNLPTSIHIGLFPAVGCDVSTYWTCRSIMYITALRLFDCRKFLNNEGSCYHEPWYRHGYCHYKNMRVVQSLLERWSLWASCQICKIAGWHAPGMPPTLSTPVRISDPDMHHGTCVTHVP